MFCRKRLAATASRVALERQSIVAPVESTALYKWVHLPATRQWVSLTLHDRFVFWSSARQRAVEKG